MSAYRDFLLRVLTIGVVVILIGGLWYLRQIVLLVFLAAIIAIALSVPVAQLQKLGLGRGLSIALTVLSVLYLFVMLPILVIPGTITQVNNLIDDLPDALESASGRYEEWRQKNEFFQGILPELDYAKIRADLTSAEDSSAENTTKIDVADVSRFALPMLGNAGNFLLALLANFLVLLFVSIFFLVDPKEYIGGGVMLVPESYRPRFLEIVSELRAAVLSWLLSIGVAMSVTAFFIWIGMGLILGIPNTTGIAIIAAASTIIPNIGSVIPFIPIIIFTLADSPTKLLIAIPMYILIQQTEANVITPQVVKRQLHIPVALTMVFQLVSALLFGFLGVLLAVPILAVVVTLVREVYVYDVLGQRDVHLDIKQDPEGRLYAVKVSGSPEIKLNVPLTLKIRLLIEPLVNRLRPIRQVDAPAS